MSLLRRSLLYSAIERYGSLVLFFVSVATLSRLLTPEEYGVYSLIMALIALALTFREFGGANYLIQKPNLSQTCIRTGFTVTFLCSCVLAALIFGLRGVAASFFDEPKLRQGLSVAALSFLVMPFAATVSALLRREMAFNQVALCGLASNLVITSSAILLAALGFGFMAPVWGFLAGNIVLSLMFLRVRPDLSIFLPCLKNWREVVGFGAYSSSTVLLNVVYQYAPQLVLARVLNFTAVGLYGRAVNITQIFDKIVIEVLNPVLMPAISGKQREGASLKPVFLDACEMITVLHWPFLLFIALLADPIVGVLFGSQWTAVVPLVRMLALASCSFFAACLIYPTLVAVGRVRDTLTSSLISVPISLVIFVVASFFGLNAVAASAFVSLPLQSAVSLWFIRRRIGVGIHDLLLATRRSAAVALCTVGAIAVPLGFGGFDLAVSIVGLFVAAVAALLGWFTGLVLTRHPMLSHLRSTVVWLAAEFRRIRATPAVSKSQASARGPVVAAPLDAAPRDTRLAVGE